MVIKNYTQYINEDLRNKNISLEPTCDNLKSIYSKIQLKYNDDLKAVISNSIEIIHLNEEFYKALEKDGVNKRDIVFENCEMIILNEVNEFTKISDYGEFGENIRDFDCSDCKNLTNLVGSPDIVYGNYSCYRCVNLESLDGYPKRVDGWFYCSRCNINPI